MLGRVDEHPLIEAVWNALACAVVLPSDAADYFQATGPVPAEFNNQRGYQRYYLRGKALLEIDGVCYPIYTKDVSRTGLAFYGGKQLFPKQRLQVIFPNGRAVPLTVVRCRRIQDQCYECGTRFIDAQ